MRRLLVLRSFLGMALGGALLGFVLVAFGGSLIAGPVINGGRVSEPVVTRTFMSGVLARDQSTLGQVRPAQGIATLAQQLQQQQQSQTAGGPQWKPSALSYLGGGEMSGIGIYMYVAEVVSLDGATHQTVPFALTVQNGKVVRVQ